MMNINYYFLMIIIIQVIQPAESPHHPRRYPPTPSVPYTVPDTSTLPHPDRLSHGG